MDKNETQRDYLGNQQENELDSQEQAGLSKQMQVQAKTLSEHGASMRVAPAFFACDLDQELEHLTYEEIFSAINTDRNSDEKSKRTLAKVLSHCAQCQLCEEEFDYLQTAVDVLDRLRDATRNILCLSLARNRIPEKFVSSVQHWAEAGYPFCPPFRITRTNGLRLMLVQPAFKAFAIDKRDENGALELSPSDKSYSVSVHEDGIHVVRGSGMPAILAVFKLPRDNIDVLGLVHLAVISCEALIQGELFEFGYQYVVIIER